MFPHREQTALFLLKKNISLRYRMVNYDLFWSCFEGQTPPSRTGRIYIGRQFSEFRPDLMEYSIHYKNAIVGMNLEGGVRY